MLTLRPPLFYDDYLLKLFECLPDNTDGFHKLRFSNDQRRSKSDDVVMCRFRYQTVFFHGQTNIPRIFAVFGFNDNGVQQTLPLTTSIISILLISTLSGKSLQVGQRFRKFFLLDNFKSGHGNFTRERVSSKCRTMFSRLDGKHDLIIGQNSRYWHSAS